MNIPTLLTEVKCLELTQRRLEASISDAHNHTIPQLVLPDNIENFAVEIISWLRPTTKI